MNKVSPWHTYMWCVHAYPCLCAVGWDTVRKICGAVAFGWGFTMLRSYDPCEQNDEDLSMTS